MLFNGPDNSQNYPFSWGDLDPIQYMVPWVYVSTPNSISIGASLSCSVFYRVHKTETERDRQRERERETESEHAACDICSNRPQLGSAAMRPENPHGCNKQCT